MKKIIVILGQTATGKSDLSVKIAKKIKGEIISADSRQVYKGLDIGTGKITKKEMKGVPHHLLDVITPKKVFTVSQYKELVDKKIKEILKRNKIPIICGGTGFYIDAITKGMILPEVPPNTKLRKVLEKKSLGMLVKMLQKLDPRRSKEIDIKNKVRLIRAIEVAKALGKVPKIIIKKPKYTFIKVGLYLPENKLQDKIQKRVSNMFKKGLIKEVTNLKLSQKRLKELGFEYFKPEKENVIKETIKYAKRQMTWFKRDPQIKWFEPSEYKKIEKYITGKL